MAKSYYASKISDNMARTPEGFLICFNVPIGRVGEYSYLSSEIGGEGNEIVSVFRTPDDLFDQITIASFEGKAFTDDHPSEDVTANNWAVYSKGEVSNVRRGKGEFIDCLVADIIVRDPITISEIENGIKREVSSGYCCDYVKRGDRIFQENIIGNHVSLVKNGRAGHRVSIKDSAIKNKNGKRIELLMCALTLDEFPQTLHKHKIIFSYDLIEKATGKVIQRVHDWEHDMTPYEVEMLIEDRLKGSRLGFSNFRFSISEYKGGKETL